jgi:hypothetical protein
MSNNWSCSTGLGYGADSLYLGFQIKKGMQYFYGWIKIYHFYYGLGYSMTLEEFACNNQLNGIHEFLKNENCLIISPNPLTSSSTLQLNTQLKNAEVVIYDVLGKEMMRRKMDGDRMEIERGSLESGVYFVRVRSEEKQWVEKLIIE